MFLVVPAPVLKFGQLLCNFLAVKCICVYLCVLTASAAVRCVELSDPSNGVVTLTGTVPNSLAIYSCNDGFNLVGRAVRTCMTSGGQWSGEAPTCECE